MVRTEVRHQRIPNDLLPHYVLPTWYPGGGNEAFIDYLERAARRAEEHNATIDAAREANRKGGPESTVPRP